MHAAMDTFGHLLGDNTAPANERERAQVRELLAQVQEDMAGLVKVEFADQGLQRREG